MSAIGGVVDFESKEVDFSTLNNMRLSMALRGRKGSSAFICSGVGMFFCSSTDEHSDSMRQPSIQERRGKSVALCIDSDGLVPRAVSEKYFIHGTDFLGCIDGAFALSLYDEEREMIVLARSKNGKKPLFYRILEDKVLFSSEPKGIIGASNGIADINRQMLDFHLTAPMGVYRATNIYSDITEVLAGECVIFTRFGISKFFFRKNRNVTRLSPQRDIAFKKENVVSFYPAFDKLKIRDYLNEALIAFDYPQFDCFMPSFMELLKKSEEQKRGSVIFEDIVRRRNLAYAREREDRLGALYGVRAIGAFTHNPPVFSEGANENLEECLREIFFGMSAYERNFLKQILGEYKLDCLLIALEKNTKKEDTERKIRILGMLCQTVEWMKARELRFLRYSREYNSNYV